MTLTSSQLASKFQIMPGRASVTYYVLGDDNTFAAGATVSNCEAERPIKNADRRSPQVNVSVHTRDWFMWTNQLGGITPKPGDKFNDGTSDWYVDEATKELLGQRWRLMATKGV